MEDSQYPQTINLKVFPGVFGVWLKYEKEKVCILGRVHREIK